MSHNGRRLGSVHATEKLSTGMEPIDRQLSGGLKPGSLLAVVAGPTTQSEALLHQILGTRPTLYLTTLRDVEAVEAGLPASISDNVFVASVGQEHALDDGLLEQITGTRNDSPAGDPDATMADAVQELVSNIDREINVVLDPTNPLEGSADRSRYRDVLNELKSTMLETGGLGVLHCTALEESPALRNVTLTISDVVWELELASTTDGLEYELVIPKNRNGAPVLDRTTIRFDSGVWVDESRAI